MFSDVQNSYLFLPLLNIQYFQSVSVTDKVIRKTLSVGIVPISVAFRGASATIRIAKLADLRANTVSVLNVMGWR